MKPQSRKGPQENRKRYEANERERRRMKHVNDAFDELRDALPISKERERGLSKVQVLKSTLVYVQELESRLLSSNPNSYNQLQELLPRYIETKMYSSDLAGDASPTQSMEFVNVPYCMAMGEPENYASYPDVKQHTPYISHPSGMLHDFSSQLVPPHQPHMPEYPEHKNYQMLEKADYLKNFD